MDIHGEETHATITHSISARRHLGDGHYGHANFGACLLARLGLGTGGLALGLTIAALARPAYAYYPAYSYGYGYPAYGYNYGGYYAPYYRSTYYYGGYRPAFYGGYRSYYGGYRPALYGGYRVARRVAIHRARWR